MMKLSSVLLLLATTSTVYGNECCLCEDTCDVLNDDILVESNDGAVVTCAQLAMTLLEDETTDKDQCSAAQESYSITCCTDRNEPAAELFLPDEFDIDEYTLEEEEPQDESLVFRLTRKLWKTSTSWNSSKKTYGSSSWKKPSSSYSSSSSSWKKPSSSYSSSKWSGGSSSKTYSSKTSSSGGSSKCSLCRDRSVPKKRTQGVVVGHYSLKFTGTCVQYDSKLKTLPATHQMCKVSQAQFIDTCGCRAGYQQTAKDKGGWGSWSW